MGSVKKVRVTDSKSSLAFKYIYINDGIYGVNPPEVDDTNIQDVIDTLDSFFGDVYWRSIPEVCVYNPYGINAFISQFAYKHFPGMRELPAPEPSGDGNVVLYDDNGDPITQTVCHFYTGPAGTSYWPGFTTCVLYTGSVFAKSACLEFPSGSDMYSYGTFTIPIFPSSIIDENGKLHLTTDVRPWIIAITYVYDLNNLEVGEHSITVTGSWGTYLTSISGDGMNTEDFTDDPYDDSDDNEGGGGPGSGDQDNWDDDSDDNPIPPFPSLSAVDTGFITLYNPSIAELKALADYMWSNLFDIATWKKLFADPMDAILGLSIVPVNVSSAAGATVTVGNISTGVTMPKVVNQYAVVDCGEIDFTEKWHSYLDYEPYTKAFIVLPYIGAHDLDINEIQGCKLGVVYHVDVLNGACTAFITIREPGSTQRVIAEYTGQCSISIPITGHDFSNTIATAANVAAQVGALIATGGMSAAAEAPQIGSAIRASSGIAGNVISAKPRIQHAGNLSHGNGLLGVQKPFVIIETPKLCLPGNQNNYTGYPSFITLRLGSVSGFTQVQDIHLNNFNMTDAERDELLQTLRTGVML